MGWNPVKEAEKKAKQAIDKVIKPAVKAGESAIKKVSEGAEKAVWRVRREAYAKIKQVGEEGVGAIEHAAKEAETGLTEKLPDLVEDAVTEELPRLITQEAPKLALELADEGLDAAREIAADVQKAIAKPGLRAAKSLLQATYDGMRAVEKNEPELVEFLDSPGFGVTLGPISMSWAGMYTRAETILGVFDRWIDSPPDWSRRDIRELLTSFGPDAIDVDVDLSVNIVVVGSKALAIGGNVPSIPFPLAVYLLDKILEAAGVPE